jgi:excinuclease ABC subunit A
VTGVSGSGKSTLVNDTLYTAVARELYRAHEEPAPHEAIEGIEHFDKVINVDQSPIGRTPRSNPATYTGLFTPIRELMAETATAKERGYGPGASRSTSPAAAAKPARATAWSRWRCTSCPTSTCPATSAAASATTARRWRCSGRAATSRRSST